MNGHKKENAVAKSWDEIPSIWLLVGFILLITPEAEGPDLAKERF